MRSLECAATGHQENRDGYCDWCGKRLKVRIRCPFLSNKWKELSGMRVDWKWLNPKKASYSSLSKTEWSSSRERLLKLSGWRTKDIARLKDRMIMSALRNGPLSDKKYLTLEFSFYETKIASAYYEVWYNREALYDMANWYYFAWLCGYYSDKVYEGMMAWISASNFILRAQGTPYTPRDRIE